ncbi:uncharacterized protein LOC116537724 isoform X7 [Sapajus apella]|uniref:Uncharacterized protein LOC116537724 isoform X7 n=1 Tax=Sapajus apella TaxID=9515 RepID=A0A6J3GDN0_SAPAP|nr:uncharacterized protein LOC116537724 isoform X7 [Sapajus apella]
MESWSQCGLASMVHLMLAGDSGWGSCLERPTMCCRNRWLIVPGSRVTMESWSQCGPASMVHLVLAGGSGRGSWLEGPTTCCHNRWSILPSNRVPMELWSRCVLAPMVHLMLAGGSGRNSCLERPAVYCHNRWLILMSSRLPMESWSQCGLASMVHLVLEGGSGWVSFHGTSTIRWQGRWSVFLGHKGPQSPRVQMAWIHGAPLLVHGSGWGSFLRGLLCAGPIDGRLFQATESPWSRGVIVAWHPWCTSCWRVAQDGVVAMGGPPPAGRKMVDSCEPQMPCRVSESVWPGFHGASCAGGWLRPVSIPVPLVGQLPWKAHLLLTRKMVDSSVSLGPTESLIRHVLACTVHPVLAGGPERSSFHEKVHHLLARKMVDSSNQWRRTESLIRRGLSSSVHPMLVGGSGRSSCHDRSIACWQGRWAILLTNRGSVGSLIHCVLTSAVHPVLVGGSGRCCWCKRQVCVMRNDCHLVQSLALAGSPWPHMVWTPSEAVETLLSWCWHKRQARVMRNDYHLVRSLEMAGSPWPHMVWTPSGAVETLLNHTCVSSALCRWCWRKQQSCVSNGSLSSYAILGDDRKSRDICSVGPFRACRIPPECK